MPHSSYYLSPSSLPLSSSSLHHSKLSPKDIETQGGFPLDLSKTSKYHKAPSPIATATFLMLEEELINSADELILLLETWLRHLGWLWVAEYLNADEQEHTIDRLLFQLFFEGKRTISTGAWAYIGSTLSNLFRSRGWALHNPTLLAFDYGNPDDPESQLSQLLKYRNSFAHGSFSAAIQDILKHRKQLWTLIEPLKELADYPLVLWDANQQCWRRDQTWEILPKQPDIPTHITAYSYNPAGERLDLSPILRLEVNSSTSPEPYQLRYFSPKYANEQERMALFSMRSHTQTHLVQYKEMREGHLDFSQLIERETLPPLPPKELEQLLKKIDVSLSKKEQRQPHIVTIIGYPGSGKTGILAKGKERFTGFDAYLFYQVRYDDPTLSAMTCARYFLHQVAKLVNNPSRLIKRKKQSPKHILQLALNTLAQHKIRTCIALDQFHLAYQPYRNETVCIADLFSTLQGCSGKDLTLLLSARPGYRDDLLGDETFRLPIVEYMQQTKYKRLLDELGLGNEDTTQKQPAKEAKLRKMLLFLLSAAPQPLTSFALCEALERLKQQRPFLFEDLLIFTPHVERALWELRPILKWERAISKEQERLVYSLFCDSIRLWMQMYLKNDLAL